MHHIILDINIPTKKMSRMDKDGEKVKTTYTF